MALSACCCNNEEEQTHVVVDPFFSPGVPVEVADDNYPNAPCWHKEEGRSFVVELDHTSENNRPGINILNQCGRVIVTGVVMPGLVSQWNCLYGGTNTEVHVGDEIMSVNGVSDKHLFARELNTSGDIRIEVRKPTLCKIHLNKCYSDLGLTIARQFVTKIPAYGFFHHWLDDNKEVVVGLGDYVLDVNGIQTWQKMKSELGSAGSLTMTVCHYETEMSKSVSSR